MRRQPRSVLCNHPGCGVILDTPGRCDAHPYPRRRSGTATPGGYGTRAWRSARDSYMRANPTCQALGCQQPARICHHRDGRRPQDPGANAWTNLAAMCDACHRLITVHPERVALRQPTWGGKVNGTSREERRRHPRTGNPLLRSVSGVRGAQDSRSGGARRLAARLGRPGGRWRGPDPLARRGRALRAGDEHGRGARREWEALGAPGVLVGPRGGVSAHRLLGSIDRAERLAADLGDRLGLSPTARRRLGRAGAGRPPGAASARDRRATVVPLKRALRPPS